MRHYIGGVGAAFCDGGALPETEPEPAQSSGPSGNADDHCVFQGVPHVGHQIGVGSWCSGVTKEAHEAVRRAQRAAEPIAVPLTQVNQNDQEAKAVTIWRDGDIVQFRDRTNPSNSDPIAIRCDGQWHGTSGMRILDKHLFDPHRASVVVVLRHYEDDEPVVGSLGAGPYSWVPLVTERGPHPDLVIVDETHVVPDELLEEFRPHFSGAWAEGAAAAERHARAVAPDVLNPWPDVLNPYRWSLETAAAKADLAMAQDAYAEAKKEFFKHSGMPAQRYVDGQGVALSGSVTVTLVGGETRTFDLDDDGSFQFDITVPNKVGRHRAPEEPVHRLVPAKRRAW